MDRYSPLSTAETFEEKRQQALSQCDRLIRDFATRADRHKLHFKRLQTASLGLAISTTILSALSASKVLGQLDWIVLAISGLATLATTLLSQTNSQKMWVQSRNISQSFQAELFLYLQDSGEYTNMEDDTERLQLFSKRLMDLWSQAQENWSQQASSRT
ncbi:DUF4231 domain-containing protein [Nodosilinea sp. FACHB-131]|uniref:DUF4231 domain-containing protein n=1 Tax=Cyanophyceae TaxID=3028117 RepID=UPI001683B63F|nr:DUF4231 domain-containing protein [Nodosilinea sp. FACHB-131]MBD1873246.1 DUF4231 domain-containing protein [Nodosilinea sp. FACHB-131]